MRDLRDIDQYIESLPKAYNYGSNKYTGRLLSEPDIRFIQRKISAGSEMKTAIKKFVDWWEHYDPNDTTDRGTRLVGDLKARMEEWLNVEAP